jgi:hypothetical protein
VDEKIKARAERFGGFQSDEAKKVARAARCVLHSVSHPAPHWIRIGLALDQDPHSECGSGSRRCKIS